MKILLDTHIFLWYINKDSRLPDNFRENIQNLDNEVYLSVVSLWESIIKHQLGKLSLPQPPEIYIPMQRERHLISSLSIDEASITQLAKLSPIHRDPFDRMIICQAIEYDMTIITVDDIFLSYPVTVLKRA